MANWGLLANFVSEKNIFTLENLEVSNNVGVGSEEGGFAFMSIPCNVV
jgi:hypothetical protein